MIINTYHTINFKKAPDCIEQKSSDKAGKYNRIFTYSMLGLTAAAISGAVIASKYMPNEYIRQLAEDLSKELGKEIKPSQLKSVMTKDELIKICKTLKEENFISNKKNVKNGIFIADLHSHSNHSDGAISVSELMNQAAEYGDKLNKLNGKKFIFALTDHDGVGGVKEALKIIAENPTKYKNVKFVPGAELSFPIECQYGSEKYKRCKNNVEMSELLIYNINPFSKNTEEYFSDLYKKRKNGITESLKLATKIIPDCKYSEEEFNKYFLLNGDNYCMLNQHWQIYHYLNLKTRINEISKVSGKNPEKLFDNIMSEFRRESKNNVGQSLDEYIKKNNIKIKQDSYDKRIIALKNQICPHIKGPQIYAPHESSFNSIVSFANKECAYLGFAHPGFTMQNMKTDFIKKEMKQFIEKADNKLIFAEKYHQAYPIPNEITKEEIESYNKILDELNLIHIGGRDNHSVNFTNFNY
ncbi:hypothetical protein IJ750_05475 [bacterium]|nr:hypothetical protein [bacterium]